MRIDHGLLTGGDSRTRLLRGALACPYAEIYGLRLWAYATEQRRWTWGRGELLPTTLAAACEYQGDAGEFLRALKTAGWLVEHEDGSLEVAGYIACNAKTVSNWANGAVSKGRPRKPIGKPNGNPTEKPTGRQWVTPENPTGNPMAGQRVANGLPVPTAPAPAPEVPPGPSPIPTPDSSPTLFESCPQADGTTETRSRFRAPSVAEVGEYCRSRGNTVDPQQFCDFYQAKGWRIGKEPMRDWRAAVRTWEARGRPNGRVADAAKDYSMLGGQ